MDTSDIKLSASTMRRELINEGLHCYIQRPKPFLSKKNINARFKICSNWTFQPDSFWETIIFSDECKFNFFSSDGNTRVWRKLNKSLDPRYIDKTLKHGGGNVMVWGCISSKGTGQLAFIETKMDRFIYANILLNNLGISAEKMGLIDYTFQHDNDPKHTSKHVKSYLEEKSIRVLEWPSQSPDLNPIEHVWAYMKREMRGKKFKNIRELKYAIIELWNSIDLEFIKNLISSMPRRSLAVLKSGGSYTKY